MLFYQIKNNPTYIIIKEKLTKEFGEQLLGDSMILSWSYVGFELFLKNGFFFFGEFFLKKKAMVAN